MSVIRPKPPEDPIEYEPADACVAGGAVHREPDAVAAGLGRSRSALSSTADAALPDRLLDAYNRPGARTTSELFAVLQAARRIRDAADRVIVLGDGCGTLGARAVFESCAHPRHNELARGERGGRPRLVFAGSSRDNDGLQGLLDLVAPAGRPRSGDLLDRWALVIAGTDDDGVGTAAAARLFLAALLESVGGDRAALADRLVVVTADAGAGGLVRLATALGCTQVFAIPEDVGAGATVFTPLGLLPAAVVGIDVVRLLQGAAALNRRFREAPVAENPVLRFAAATLGVTEPGGRARMLASPTGQLDAVCRWYGRLAARDGVPMFTSLVVGEPRRDPLVVPALPAAGADDAGCGELAGTAWPDLPGAGPTDPRADTDRILLPRIDEHSIGQLLQLLVLAERRL